MRHREWIPILENDQDMTRLASQVRHVLAGHAMCHAFLLRRGSLSRCAARSSRLAGATSAGGHLFVGQPAGATASVPPFIGRCSHTLAAVVFRHAGWAEDRAGQLWQHARTMGIPADSIVFVSDITRELTAARAAGMQVR